MKKTTTINLEPAILDFLDLEAGRLSVSRNALIEALTIFYIEQRHLPLTSSQIDDFVNGFPLKKRGNASQTFRSTIHTLAPQDQWALVVFHASLHFFPDVEVSVNKFSNIWKDGDTISYFAYGTTIGRQSVEDLVNKQLSSHPHSVTNICNPPKPLSECPFVFSCLQQLLHPQSYPLWQPFLTNLGLPPCVKIIVADRHALLHTILPALESL